MNTLVRARRLTLCLSMVVVVMAAGVAPALATAPGVNALYVAQMNGRQVTFGWEGSIISYRARALGWQDAIGYWQAEVSDVAVSGGVAYVAAGLRGLRFVAVGDPAHAVEVGAYEPANESFMATRVAVRGWYAYVADLHVVRVIDVSVPSAPVLVSQMWVDGTSTGIEDVEVVGDYAYVVGYTAADTYPFPRSYSLLVYDVSDPANPVWKGSCDLADTSAPMRLTVHGGHAYVGGSYLCIVDVADPVAPRWVSYAWTGNKKSSLCAGPAVDDRYAFVAADDKMGVFNISRPGSPAFAGSLLAAWPYSTGVGVALTDPGTRKRYALVAYDKAGDLNGFVQIVDVSRPLRLDHDHDELRDGGAGDINSITVSGDWAYVGRGSDTRDNLVIAHLGPTAYSWVFDRRAGTVPDKRADGPQTGLRASITVTAHSRGNWYFHVRGRDRGGHWGTARTLKVRID